MCIILATLNIACQWDASNTRRFRTKRPRHNGLNMQPDLSVPSTSLETLLPVERDPLPIFPGENRRTLERPFDPTRGNADHRANEQRVVLQSAPWLGGSHEPTDR
jgi:hypothetical protein